MKTRPRNTILVVDDDKSVTGALAVILRGAGYEVLIANSFTEAQSILSRRSFDLVITDLRLSDGEGIDLITYIKKQTPDTEVILMTAFGSVEITIEAIKRGAYYYLEKPYTPDRLLALVERTFQFAATRSENRSLKRTLAGETESSTGNVTLNGAAPAGGASITLRSSDTGKATVPPVVIVPEGATSATFVITTFTGRLGGGRNPVTITATLGSTSVSATLNILRP